VVGIIIVAWGPQAGGGQVLQRSPRLNQLLQELRLPHVLLQPARHAIVTTTPVSISNLLVMAFPSGGAQVSGCIRATLALGRRGANATVSFWQREEALSRRECGSYGF
jgi:hypothetical protein